MQITKYLIKLINGTEIPIDEDEVAGVKEALTETGQLIQVRQGLFNSSSFSALIEDETRSRIAHTAKGVDGKLLNEKLSDIFSNILCLSAEKQSESKHLLTSRKSVFTSI